MRLKSPLSDPHLIRSIFMVIGKLTAPLFHCRLGSRSRVVSFSDMLSRVSYEALSALGMAKVLLLWSPGTLTKISAFLSQACKWLTGDFREEAKAIGIIMHSTSDHKSSPHPQQGTALSTFGKPTIRRLLPTIQDRNKRELSNLDNVSF